jgi:hypothetical protein
MNGLIPVPLITANRNGSKVDCLLLPFFSFPVLSHVDKKQIRFYCLTNTGSKKKPGFKEGELISFGDEEFDDLFDCFEFFLDYQSSDQNSLMQVFAIEVPVSFVDMSVFSGFFA